MKSLKYIFYAAMICLIMGCGGEEVNPIVYPECTIPFPEFEPFSMCGQESVFSDYYCEIEDGGVAYLLPESREQIPQFCLDEGLLLPYKNADGEIIELEVSRTRHSRGGRTNVLNSIDCPNENKYYGYCIIGESITVVLENEEKNISFEISVSTSLQDNRRAFSDLLVVEREFSDNEFVTDFIKVLDRRESSQGSSPSIDFENSLELNRRIFSNVYSDGIFGVEVYYNKDFGLIGFQYLSELWVLEDF